MWFLYKLDFICVALAIVLSAMLSYISNSTDDQSNTKRNQTHNKLYLFTLNSKKLCLKARQSNQHNWICWFTLMIDRNNTLVVALGTPIKWRKKLKQHPYLIYIYILYLKTFRFNKFNQVPPDKDIYPIVIPSYHSKIHTHSYSILSLPSPLICTTQSLFKGSFEWAVSKCWVLTVYLPRASIPKAGTKRRSNWISWLR